MCGMNPVFVRKMIRGDYLGYYVQYGKTTIKSKSCRPLKKFKLNYMILVVVLTLGVLCFKGRNGILFRALFPGNPDVTFSALKDLTENIKSGEPLGNSVTAFCREIIDDAQTPGA